MRKSFVLLFGLIFSLNIYAQLYIPAGNEIYHFTDRMEIKSNDLLQINIHSSCKPYTYQQVYNFRNLAVNITSVDSSNFIYFKNDYFFETKSGKRAKPILKHFYTQNAALYQVNEENFKLSVNPVLYFASAFENVENAGTKSHQQLYMNTRGAELQGMVDRISFYAFATDNQMRVPLQTQLFGAKTYALPGESFYKNFKGNGVDFFHAEGYISTPISKHINMQFGTSKQFIGDGVRSLILSDFSKQHLFLKFNTNIWRINYQNIYYEMVDSAYTTGAGTYKKKFGATHHLSINASKNFNIGFFETVIFKRENNAYELNYLNPIIFYRAVEHSLGSPDNVILGLDFKWDFLHHFQVYGQIVLDEFLLANMRAQFIKPKTDPSWGWWANKYAAQLGLKVIDIAKIKNLDLQIEYNHIRPYTYGYTNTSLNFTDFNQSMAHPLGANLKELVVMAFYQPTANWNIQVKTFNTITGIDTSSTLSYGADLLKSSYLKVSNFGNETGQGLRAMIQYYEFKVTYLVAQQLYIDAGYTYRTRKTNEAVFNNKNQYFTFGIRLHATSRNLMY